MFARNPLRAFWKGAGVRPAPASECLKRITINRDARTIVTVEYIHDGTLYHHIFPTNRRKRLEFIEKYATERVRCDGWRCEPRMRGYSVTNDQLMTGKLPVEYRGW